jgi:GDP-4-dehydro-6-deoxy-D-mannose reductase
VEGPTLVTGAGGFVGRHLLTELGDAAVPTEADVTDPAAIAQALTEAKPRAVVHLAALSSVADSWGTTAEVWRVNVLGTVTLLQAVKLVSPEARVLFASTGQVYGIAQESPTPESAAIAPISPYAASKAAAEIAAAQAREDGLDVVIARAFQHEGPGRDERFAIGSWTRQIAELETTGGGALKVGDLSAQRDITDVRDVVRAYRALLDRSVPREAYNVSSGSVVSMQEIVERLVAMAQVPVTIEVDPRRSRPTDLPVVCGDASKLTAATGWQPRIPLDQTLADALEHARAAVAERMAKA